MLTDSTAAAALFIGMFLLVIILPVIGGAMFSRYSCYARAAAIELEYKWGLASGCNVKFKNTWMPIDQIGVREIN